MNKGIILGVVFLFVGLCFQPAFATSTGSLVINKLTLELTIEGPTNGVVGVYYSYIFRLNDSEGFYLFVDWGDGAYEDWLGPLDPEIELQHSWCECGNYTIRARARDVHGREYDARLDVTIIENHPPEAPNVWWSPKYPKIGETINLTFNAVDPDGDDVKFLIEWPDGETDTTTYVPSGTNTTISFTAGNNGTYIITITAEDYNGAMGDGTTIKIIVGKSKAITNNILLGLFERFPLLWRIVSRLNVR